MKKFNVVAASAVALSAALASGSALAAGSLAVTTANYNAAAVAAGAGTITVPWNGLASAVYTVAATTSLEVNSRFTVTLPAGFTFASQPSLTTTAPTTTALTGGGIGSQTATFTIGSPAVAPGNTPVPAGGTLTLNEVSVSGATALETAGASLNITVQATNNALVTNNDLNPVSSTTPAFTSDTGVIATFVGGGASIDLKSPTLGKLFLQGAGPADTTTANIGTVTLTSSGSLGANGAPDTLSTSDSATLTITGFFNGIASATAGGVTATPSGTTLTFPNVPFTLNALTAPITLTSANAGLLQQNPASGFPLVGLLQPGFVVNYAPGANTVDFLGGSAANATDSIAYTNGQVVPVTNFLTGDDAGYTSLLRVNNAGVVPADVFALVQPYTGGPQLVGNLDTTLAAGTGTVFLETQIEAQVPGFTLANSGQRATLTIIAVGPGVGQVAASGLLVNPGGVVVNVN
ncbi:MAG: hypothetical protein WCC64_10755 [Aliidongia sp.]